MNQSGRLTGWTLSRSISRLFGRRVVVVVVAVFVAASTALFGLRASFAEPSVTIVRTQLAEPDFATVSQAWDVAAIDGGFVAAGVAADVDGDEAISGAVRYRADGSLDDQFGDGGVVRIQGSSPGSFGSTARSVAVDARQRVVLAGVAAGEHGHAQVGLQRLAVDGSIDPSFGDQGVVRTQAAAAEAAVPESEAHDVVIDSSGRIVVAGMASSAQGGREFAVLRYLESGALDASFGIDGVARIQPRSTSSSNPRWRHRPKLRRWRCGRGRAQRPGSLIQEFVLRRCGHPR